MFLINSSVGSFAAAPTSLDTKVFAFKKLLDSMLAHAFILLLSQKKSHKLSSAMVIKKDFSTLKYFYQERTHAISLLSPFNLKLLLSERDIQFLSTEVGADLIPKLRSLYCRVP